MNFYTVIQDDINLLFFKINLFESEYDKRVFEFEQIPTKTVSFGQVGNKYFNGDIERGWNTSYEHCNVVEEKNILLKNSKYCKLSFKDLIFTIYDYISSMEIYTADEMNGTLNLFEQVTIIKDFYSHNGEYKDDVLLFKSSNKVNGDKINMVVVHKDKFINLYFDEPLFNKFDFSPKDLILKRK